MRKDELEKQLKDEHDLIKDGLLKDDSPLDSSQEFRSLCDACRRGDLKTCQEMVQLGTNINARDEFDYTPLILASLCGHYEVVQLLLEAGALCERDTFQGERCLYNALNNKIRNLLLQYDYSKSTDPLQPLASHITSLLTRRVPDTSDIILTASSEAFHMHKFILSARSPYFHKKLVSNPETKLWRLPNAIPAEAFQVALRYLYLGDVPSDLGLSTRSFVTEEDVFKGIDRVSKHLEIDSLWEGILAGSDRRIARQRHQDEVQRGQTQLEAWYTANIVKNKIVIDTARTFEVKWTRDNKVFADILLQADERSPEADTIDGPIPEKILGTNGIPIGPRDETARVQKSTLFPAHRAMLLRSEYFATMFSSEFAESIVTDNLRIVPVECTPEVLQVVLNFLYTEKADFSLDLAVEVLFAADMLFIEKLKTKAAVIISTLGSGSGGALVDPTHAAIEAEVDAEAEEINVFDVLRAAWITRVQRLEEFAARYLAYRLEDYIDDEEFEELIQESASRIQKRQETDSIELLDDIRYYLSERFRLRFEDSGLEEMMDENGEMNTEAAVLIADASNIRKDTDEAIDVSHDSSTKDLMHAAQNQIQGGQIRTLDGEIAGDEFGADAINYQVLLGKIDALLQRLKLDA